MLPLIGVTAGEVINNNEEWAPIVYGQAHTYTDAVLHASGVPLIVPLMDDEPALRKLYDQCAGLLLSGGNDIDPALYDAKPSPRLGRIARRRDNQEKQLLEWALADDKPVLGICRGMQLLNVVLGGSLYQDIASEVPSAHNHQVSEHAKSFEHLAHSLKIKPGSRLAALVGPRALQTNALHHQALRELGRDLKVSARAEDGIIEGLELPNRRFVVAVQSHPEALEVLEPRWRQLFEGFVAAASKVS